MLFYDGIVVFRLGLCMNEGIRIFVEIYLFSEMVFKINGLALHMGITIETLLSRL